ncbi:MAG: hypothetical protein C5B47_08225 [Verrucomicrobia bacterium]|nr:MAG: hypothetical protein C5B47_08225 [Verrucomicrobiota bacterium]
MMIRGEELPGDWESEDWDQVEYAFGDHTEIPLQQWKENSGEISFESASVRIGWRHDKIYVLATMEDRSIVTGIPREDQQLWERGDAVEVFLQSFSASECYQLQATPDGETLQLGYPDTDVITNLRHGNMAELSHFVVCKPVFAVRTQVKDGKWRILVEVPSQVLFSDDGLLLGRACWLSVCRHDHWADARPPCVSSTSPHLKTDYHQQKDWGLVYFVMHRAR